MPLALSTKGRVPVVGCSGANAQEPTASTTEEEAMVLLAMVLPGDLSSRCSSGGGGEGRTKPKLRRVEAGRVAAARGRRPWTSPSKPIAWLAGRERPCARTCREVLKDGGVPEAEHRKRAGELEEVSS